MFRTDTKQLNGQEEVFEYYRKIRTKLILEVMSEIVKIDYSIL
ncbi:hypothetical protein [Clostridium sp. FP2]|nr:hypothetical protein [Clostridium sp. FP2]